MRSGPALWPAVFITMIALAGCGGGHTSVSGALPPANPGPSPSVSPVPGPSPTPVSAVPVVAHVVLVVLENHSLPQVIGSPFMPFLNSLASQNSLATNYFANVHNSIGNYFMLTAGRLESTDDNFAGTINDDNIVRELTAAGKSWKAYMESLPSQGYTGNDVLPYVKHHDPFTYFTDVLDSSSQWNQVVPFSQLSTDMAAGTT